MVSGMFQTALNIGYFCFTRQYKFKPKVSSSQIPVDAWLALAIF